MIDDHEKNDVDDHDEDHECSDQPIGRLGRRPPEIDLNDSEQAALDAVWAKIVKDNEQANVDRKDSPSP